MNIDLRETENFLHQKIPITHAMGVRVTGYDEQALVLEAPLALNHNHLGTAFGGSLGSMAMLAGYALLWLELRDHECHVVIRERTISFRRPLRGDIQAGCHPPEVAAMEKV